MLPRTLFAMVFLIVASSLALRFAVVHFGWLPVSQEVVLRKAEAVSITYYVRGLQKTAYIDDPTERQSLLSALSIQRDDNYGYGGLGMANFMNLPITFHFPGMKTQQFNLQSPSQMGHYQIDRAFHEKLNEIVSRREGQKVDVLDLRMPPPAQFNNQGFNPNW